MKVNEILHGFRVKRKRDIAGIGTLYEAVYEKNGAELVYFDRDDTNKSFAIGFKTLPSDDTGVFHIIEHSVLCGSEKYPVREPFVELLKSSLNTFLNAMTFDDKTVYPVASRNEKDFLNLVSVYMDAVLHPKMLTMPEIFHQEGWHYELFNESDAPSYKGVVYNEMKGAYSSADELVFRYICSLLYPDNCYRHDSGGDPEAIPSLTYGEFVEAHAKYYHPSNAKIFLDGQMDLDRVLALLDGFLSPYDYQKIDTDIPRQNKTGRVERTIEYEIGETESPDSKARIALGCIVSDFDECEKTAAFSVIADVLAGSNEAPLKKALLERGLCEDVSVSLYDGVMQNAIIIELKNTSQDKREAIESTIREVLYDAVKSGISRERLRATLDHAELKAREADFGSMPKGLVYCLAAFETWLYGKDPALCLDRAKIYVSLKEKLDTPYFEELIKECILENDSIATLILLPSRTLGKERRERENARLLAVKESWSEDDARAVLEENERLRLWQSTPETEAELSTIPRLTLSDVSDTPEQFPVIESETDSVKVITYETDTSGIAYTELIFNLSDLSEDELAAAAFLAIALTNLPTKRSDVVTLQSKIKANLGAFSASVDALMREKTNEPLPYLSVGISALCEKKKKIVELASEILNETLYSDKKLVRDLVKQTRMLAEMNFAEAGHALAISRASAKTSEVAAIRDCTSGYAFYLEIKKIDESIDTDPSVFIKKLEALAKRIFTRDRLTIAETGEHDSAFAALIASSFRAAGEPVLKRRIPLAERVNEGLAIPAQVSFAALSCNLDHIGEKNHGSLAVVRNILSYGHLWSKIRVQGGAYGAGLSLGAIKNVAFYSYRDPSAVASLRAYAESGDYLRAFAESGEDITGFIIGAVGDSEPLLTPRTAGSVAINLHLRGVSQDEREARRRELISTSREDILRAADIMDKVCENGFVTVIGGRDKLEACGDRLQKIVDVI